MPSSLSNKSEKISSLKVDLHNWQLLTISWDWNTRTEIVTYQVNISQSTFQSFKEWCWKALAQIIEKKSMLNLQTTLIFCSVSLLLLLYFPEYRLNIILYEYIDPLKSTLYHHYILFIIRSSTDNIITLSGNLKKMELGILTLLLSLHQQELWSEDKNINKEKIII